MHLLFDLDGTLTDSREGIVRCFQHALREIGHDVPSEADLYRFIGPPLRKCFATLLETDDDARIERAVSIYRARYAPIGMFENQLYPGTLEALAALRSNGHSLHVVTAKAAAYSRRIAEHFGIDRFLSSLHGPELTDTAFAKASLVRRVLDENEVTSRDAVMIGDRVDDVVAARENDVRSIGVTWGFGSREELAGADDVVDSWDELLSRVGVRAA